jgi:hypothetical protein
VAMACTQGRRRQHGKPHSVVGCDDQPKAGDGRRGRYVQRTVIIGDFSTTLSDCILGLETILRAARSDGQTLRGARVASLPRKEMTASIGIRAPLRLIGEFGHVGAEGWFGDPHEATDLLDGVLARAAELYHMAPLTGALASMLCTKKAAGEPVRGSSLPG